MARSCAPLGYRITSFFTGCIIVQKHHPTVRKTAMIGMEWDVVTSQKIRMVAFWLSCRYAPKGRFVGLI